MDYIFPGVCNRSQKTSQRVKDNSHATRRRLVSSFFVLCTPSVIYYSTHTEKCYLFVKYLAPVQTNILVAVLHVDDISFIKVPMK